MLKDYRLQIRVKNNYLLTAMERAGIWSVADLAVKSGVRTTSIYNIANLKLSGKTKSGDWRVPLLKISGFLRCLPEDLVPPQHHDTGLKVNNGEMNLSLDEALALGVGPTVVPPPDILLEQQDVSRLLGEGVERLSERERTVMTKRFGLDGEGEYSLGEVGELLGVSGPRVGQIEAKALRKLASPTTGKNLYEAWAGYKYKAEHVKRLHGGEWPRWSRPVSPKEETEKRRIKHKKRVRVAPTPQSKFSLLKADLHQRKKILLPLKQAVWLGGLVAYWRLWTPDIELKYVSRGHAHLLIGPQQRNGGQLAYDVWAGDDVPLRGALLELWAFIRARGMTFL